MRKCIIAAIILVTSLAVSGGSAAADTPGCVHRSEFRAVQRHDTQRSVHAVFDTQGFVIRQSTQQGYRIQDRLYGTCARRWAVVRYVRAPGSARYLLSSKAWS